MSRKLIALFAFLMAALTTWADPGGGEGGCVNLPGGRNGSRPSSESESFEVKVGEHKGVLFSLPAEMMRSAVLVRGASVPIHMFGSTVDGYYRVPEGVFQGLRAIGDSGLTVDFLTYTGQHLHVQVRFADGFSIVRVP